MTRIDSIYVIGSLRNPRITEIANKIQQLDIEAFADWHQPGPEADDFWKKYSQDRGWTYEQALKSHGADQIFEFDKHHLDRTDAAVLIAPAGKSAHCELGYTIGRSKPGFYLFPDGEPQLDRWDVMVKFATKIFFSVDDLLAELQERKKHNPFDASLPKITSSGRGMAGPITGAFVSREEWEKKAK